MAAELFVRHPEAIVFRHACNRLDPPVAILVLDVEGRLREVRIDEAPDRHANDSRYVLTHLIDSAAATVTECVLCGHIVLTEDPRLAGLRDDLFRWEPGRYLEHTAGTLLAVVAVAPKNSLGLAKKSDRNISTSTRRLPLCHFCIFAATIIMNAMYSI
jgi:hypothetical protein